MRTFVSMFVLAIASAGCGSVKAKGEVRSPEVVDLGNGVIMTSVPEGTATQDPNMSTGELGVSEVAYGDQGRPRVSTLPPECLEPGHGFIREPIEGSSMTISCSCDLGGVLLNWSQVLFSPGDACRPPLFANQVRTINPAAAPPPVAPTTATSPPAASVPPAATSTPPVATATATATTASLVIKYECETGKKPQRMLCADGKCETAQTCTGDNLRCLDDAAQQQNFQVPPCLCADGKAPTQHVGQSYICS